MPRHPYRLVRLGPDVWGLFRGGRGLQDVEQVGGDHEAPVNDLHLLGELDRPAGPFDGVLAGNERIPVLADEEPCAFLPEPVDARAGNLGGEVPERDR